MKSLETRISDMKSTIDKGFTGVDTWRDAKGESRDVRADTRGNIALWVAGGSLMLTLLLTIFNAVVVHMGH